ncbi:MAG: large conductance mechanosensitive channel protein MscL [Microbacteriaceae bacterium]|jgi:large conductance mechanosensitive channel|nr:large conductance mechanosensitive channel protein MscL [Microbacteriaceae bacterium]MCI1206680.1 large conductance mechanosensitive channel protein MscL [Microbacteriaceae bacterium]
MLKGFREFISRGNAIDLAVGVIIGAAFSGVVTALVKWLIMPIIAAIFGKPDFNALWVFTINGAQFRLGAILTAVVNFLLVALALYFFIVLPMNKLKNYQHRNDPVKPAEESELEVLKSIRTMLQEETPGTSTGAHASGN